MESTDSLQRYLLSGQSESAYLPVTQESEQDEEGRIHSTSTSNQDGKMPGFSSNNGIIADIPLGWQAPERNSIRLVTESSSSTAANTNSFSSDLHLPTQRSSQPQPFLSLTFPEFTDALWDDTPTGSQYVSRCLAGVDVIVSRFASELIQKMPSSATLPSTSSPSWQYAGTDIAQHIQTEPSVLQLPVETYCLNGSEGKPSTEVYMQLISRLAKRLCNGDEIPEEDATSSEYEAMTRPALAEAILLYYKQSGLLSLQVEVIVPSICFKSVPIRPLRILDTPMMPASQFEHGNHRRGSAFNGQLSMDQGHRLIPFRNSHHGFSLPPIGWWSTEDLHPSSPEFFACCVTFITNAKMPEPLASEGRFLAVVNLCGRPAFYSMQCEPLDEPFSLRSSPMFTYRGSDIRLRTALTNPPSNHPMSQCMQQVAGITSSSTRDGIDDDVNAALHSLSSAAFASILDGSAPQDVPRLQSFNSAFDHDAQVQGEATPIAAETPRKSVPTPSTMDRLGEESKDAVPDRNMRTQRSLLGADLEQANDWSFHPAPLSKLHLSVGTNSIPATFGTETTLSQQSSADFAHKKASPVAVISGGAKSSSSATNFADNSTSLSLALKSTPEVVLQELQRMSDALQWMKIQIEQRDKTISDLSKRLQVAQSSNSRGDEAALSSMAQPEHKQDIPRDSDLRNDCLEMHGGTSSSSILSSKHVADPEAAHSLPKESGDAVDLHSPACSSDGVQTPKSKIRCSPLSTNSPSVLGGSVSSTPDSTPITSQYVKSSLARLSVSSSNSQASAPFERKPEEGFSPSARDVSFQPGDSIPRIKFSTSMLALDMDEGSTIYSPVETGAGNDSISTFAAAGGDSGADAMRSIETLAYMQRHRLGFAANLSPQGNGRVSGLLDGLQIGPAIGSYELDGEEDM